MRKNPNPLTDKKDIQRNPDNKIDQDFSGFPHGTATEKLITPVTKQEKKVAGIDITDGEKLINHLRKLMKLNRMARVVLLKLLKIWRMNNFTHKKIF